MDAPPEIIALKFIVRLLRVPVPAFRKVLLRVIHSHSALVHLIILQLLGCLREDGPHAFPANVQQERLSSIRRAPPA
eukprot:3199771-Pyramimonas_sp.AAC.1